MEIEGTGNQESEQFIVSKGVLVLMANYEGNGRFKLTVTDPVRDMEPSIDVIGPYFGNLLITAYYKNIDGMATGGHTIKVEADGPWLVRLFQDFPAIGKMPTVEVGCVGDGCGGCMQLDE